jgi:hypothetical protein
MTEGQMIELSDKQRVVLLQLGDTKSVHEVVPIAILHELVQLGLVYKRNSDGNLDFTDLGEVVHDQLVGG